MISLLDRIEHTLTPWQSVYNNSKLLATVVVGVHLVALLIGGGLAIAADRATLRLVRASAVDRARQLMELRAVHRPVLISLVFIFASGVLLTAADVRTFFTSPAFYVKMALVLLLLVNGAVLSGTETRLRAANTDAEAGASKLWTRLRASTVWSIALWTAATVASVVLQNAS